MLVSKKGIYILMIISIFDLNISGCASMKSLFSSNKVDEHRPISNPFAGYQKDPRGESSDAMILRTKKGDRTIEIEIPGDAQKLSDFSIPVSPHFNDSGRSLASANSSEKIDNEHYKNHAYSTSDYDLVKQLSKTSEETEKRRLEVENALNLTEENASNLEKSDQETTSYLGGIDTIKELFRNKRYEAALLSTDDMIRKYQTDPKLYEMKGTLLDRIGNRELAIQSWEQSLRFNPHNATLKKFIERKRSIATVRNP